LNKIIFKSVSSYIFREIFPCTIERINVHAFTITKIFYNMRFIIFLCSLREHKTIDDIINYLNKKVYSLSITKKFDRKL